jgi:predicted GTPase
VRLADVVIINKVDTASAENVAQVRANVASANPTPASSRRRRRSHR